MRPAYKLLLFFILFTTMLKAEAQSKFAIGVNVNKSLYSYGAGISISSPMLANSFQLRLGMNVMGVPGTPVSGIGPIIGGYELFRLGIAGKGINIGELSKLYWEGGPLLIVNSRAVTDRPYNIGGYGVMGFEYRMLEKTSVFAELGGIGTGAKAEKFIGQPMFSTGPFVGAGLRRYL